MTDGLALRYCTTADGVRLATATQGRGPAIVKAANWLSHLEQESTLFASRHWIAELSRRHTLVRYDSRGCGLSDRRVPTVSLDAWVSDLEAVADAAAPERFVLFGVSQGAAVALSYAARHPQRVRALVLYGAFARGMLRQGGSPRVEAAAQTLIRMAELGWGADTASFRKVFTSHIFKSASEEQLRAFDDCHRDTVSGEVAAQYMRVFYELDVRETAARVTCPTLVLHCRDDALVLAREGRLLASLIPGARYVEVPGVNHLPLEPEPGWVQIRGELRAFLAALDSAEAMPAAPRLTPRQLEVLRLVAAGQGDKEIGRTLGLSPRTVEMHVARILAALGVRNRAEAVGSASLHKLLD